MQGTDIIHVFFILMISAAAFAQETAFAATFATARGAMSAIFELLDSESEVDLFKETGRTLEHVTVRLMCMCGFVCMCVWTDVF
jgi:hypothetical protein